MQKVLVFACLFILSFNVWGQEAALPPDLRQHSLTQFNASLFNATYSLDWNNPKSLSLWTRWQWQTIDDDPTSLFLNYSHSLNPDTAIGLGFLQHNTGVFLNTGGVLNFARSFSLKSNMNLIVGANILLFSQELADERFNTNMDISNLEGTTNFVAQFSPSVRLNINEFNVGVSLENTVDYNFTQNENANNSKIFTGIISNDFPIVLLPSIKESYVRPSLYVRSIPDFDTQYGANMLLSTAKFWVQGGYNSFYGPSGGLGATLFGAFSIGGLVEFATSNELDNEDLTFELVASYHFGKAEPRKKVVDLYTEEEVADQEIPQEKEKKKRKSRKEIKAEAEAQEELNRIKEAKQREQKFLEQEALKRKTDSLDLVKEKEIAALRERNRLDSIAKLEQTEEVAVQPNEKYEEVKSSTIEGLEPGFYLIANVFGTKKYFDAFMQSMTRKGLNPKSFYRAKNKFNYVYLGKYNSIEEARKARNSNLNGRYEEKTWIFRVRE
jgi:type IX secretion system PorP/SprF family membrane protein